VGVVRYVRDGDLAEVAVTVVDAWQGRGVGTVLLDALLGHARKHGVSRLWASVMVENGRAIRLARRFGAQRRPISTVGVVEYELPLTSERDGPDGRASSIGIDHITSSAFIG
jgi:acetyltransferase